MRARWHPSTVCALCFWKRFLPIIKWIFTPCAENRLLFVLNKGERQFHLCFCCVTQKSRTRGQKSIQATCACFTSGKVGHMPESCAPMRGRTWGHTWLAMKMGEQHWSVPVTGIGYKGNRQFLLFLFLYCTCWCILCMCNDRLHFCVVQERGSLSLDQGSVNWHGYTPSCSDPGAVWAAIKAQLALGSLLPTVL